MFVSLQSERIRGGYDFTFVLLPFQGALAILFLLPQGVALGYELLALSGRILESGEVFDILCFWSLIC